MIHKATSALFIGMCLLVLPAQAQKKIKLKPNKSVSIDVPEPSDICYNTKTSTFFVVSDQGILFEMDENGKVIRKKVQKDTDFEAVYSDDKSIYAVDESNRTIYEYDIANFNKIKTTTIPYSGPRNKGYESFTYDENNKKYIIITESDPTIVFELDATFKIIKETDISSIANDISSARFYKNELFLLSDEDSMLIKVDPNNYQVLNKWRLPVINPEGLAFDKSGNILITCDDMQRLYYFNNPEKQ